MINYAGDFPLNATVKLPFESGSTGLLSSVVIKVYANGAGAGATTGVTSATQVTGANGSNTCTVVATTANGFVINTDYHVWLVSALLGIAATGPSLIGSFSIQNRSLEARLPQALTASGNMKSGPQEFLSSLDFTTPMKANIPGAAPTATANASAVRTELTTELGRLDVAVSTRATPAHVTNAQTAIIAALPAAAPSAATNASAVRTNLTVELALLAQLDAPISGVPVATNTHALSWIAQYTSSETQTKIGPTTFTTVRNAARAFIESLRP